MFSGVYKRISEHVHALKYVQALLQSLSKPPVSNMYKRGAARRMLPNMYGRISEHAHALKCVQALPRSSTQPPLKHAQALNHVQALLQSLTILHSRNSSSMYKRHRCLALAMNQHRAVRTTTQTPTRNEMQLCMHISYVVHMTLTFRLMATIHGMFEPNMKEQL